MTAISMSRIAVPSLAVVAACGVALVFGIQHFRREPPIETNAPTTAPAVSKPAGARDQASASLAAAQKEASTLAAALAGSNPPPDTGDGVPSFDIARIEPTGEAVIAGRAAPGATVELLRNGEPQDRVVVDQSGQFAMVPPRLPPGNYELTLRARQPDGKETLSKQSVAVALEPNAQERPVVALITPDKPSVILSQPAAPNLAGGTVAVQTVEAERGGTLHVSGRSPAGATVRLYLNDSFVAAATADAEGHVAFTVKKGVAAGDYRIRLDEAASNSDAVRSRAEVPFNVPDTVVATNSVPEQTAGSKRQVAAAKSQDKSLSDESSPSAVVVPRIATTTVSRGDSLWRISQAAYGAGTRYAVIYNANRKQIRNPNRIYPGQIIVLPVKAR
jgi:nucleoid-associated protein YgaU